MTRYIIAAAALCIAGPALAQQTVTSPIELVDSSPDTAGLIVNKAVTTPRAAKGTVLFACGRDGLLWRYSVGKPCPPVESAAITAPRVTTATMPGAGNAAAPRRTDLHMARAMDAYNFRAIDGYDDVRISDVRFDLTRTVIYNAWQSSWGAAATPASGSVRGLTVERVEAVCGSYCIALGRESRDIAIRDFRLTSAAPSTSSSIPVGIRLAESAHDILIERGYIAGFRQTPRSFTNGDCISAERGNVNVTIRDVVCENPADGGYDLKSSNTRLDQLTARRAGHESYRLWATGTAGTLTSVDPGKYHIWASKTAIWTVAKLIAVGDAPLAYVEGGGQLEIKACDLSGWHGTKLAVGEVTLGPGCKP